MTITIDQALELFDRLQTEEHGVREAQLDEGTSWVKSIQRAAALNAFFDGDQADTFVPVLDRPRTPDAAWFEEARAKAAAPRVIHAATEATIDDETVVLVYAKSTRVDLEMNDRFTVAEVGTGWRKSEPKIVAAYTRCGECSTKLGLALKADPDHGESLSGCGVCKRQGWRFANAGHDHNKPKPSGELCRLTVPTDPFAKHIFDQL